MSASSDTLAVNATRYTLNRYLHVAVVGFTVAAIVPTPCHFRVAHSLEVLRSMMATATTS